MFGSLILLQPGVVLTSGARVTTEGHVYVHRLCHCLKHCLLISMVPEPSESHVDVGVLCVHLRPY